MRALILVKPPLIDHSTPIESSELAANFLIVSIQEKTLSAGFMGILTRDRIAQGNSTFIAESHKFKSLIQVPLLMTSLCIFKLLNKIKNGR
jgi:hypothetical protein